MSVATPSAAPTATTPKPRPPAAPAGCLRRNGFRIAVLVPSLVLVAVFVYGFIGYSVRVSTSRWQGLVPNLRTRQPPYQTYVDMFHTARFQADLRNVAIFTVLFLT